MMKILVTGANGLLGRRLIKTLSVSYDAHAVVRKMPDDPVSSVTYHVADLGGEWSAQSFPQNVNSIFHLAQSENFRDFPDKAMDVFKVNIDSTARLLDYAQRTGVKRFVYASSGGVYGAGSHILNENSPITPHGQLGYYLGSKLCSEILVENYAPYMLVNIIRFFFVYGPEQKKSMLIPRLISSVRNGVPIMLQGHNGISINPIHAEDAAEGLRKMMSFNESCILNMAGKDIHSIRDIAYMAGKLLGKEPIFEMQTNSGKNLIADIQSMTSILGPPSIDLPTGLREFIADEE